MLKLKTNFLLCLLGTIICTSALSTEFKLEYHVIEAAPSLEYMPRQYELRVKENGHEYIIESKDKESWYQEAFHKTVHIVADLDGDTIPEAIIKTNNGGNCCAPSYFIIKRHEKGFYSILSHNELVNVDGVTVSNTDNKRVIKVMQSASGAGLTALSEEIVLMALIDGKLEVLSKNTNDAYLIARMQLTSEEIRGIGQKTIRFDIDNDQNADELTCSYWDRWGDINCSIQSSSYGKLQLAHSCKRVGILSTKHNGLNELVCNLNEVMRYDIRSSTFLPQLN